MRSAADPGAAAPRPIIEADALTVGYGDTVILENLAFDVPRARVFAILGGSGSGKSTVLRNLIGLDAPLGGRLLVDGAPPEQQAGPPRFGVLFQSGALFGSMTLAQNVALPLRKWTDLDADAIDVVVRSKLRLVGLEGFENHLPAEISGGMKKRAGIARALALDPSLVFLDEPSAGLDPISSVELDELISTLSQSLGMTTVIVTHELASIFAIAHECILVDRGARGIIARGEPTALRDHSDDPRVRAFFNRKPV
jgi:phospholipid/cholesterol/gamma-HCH transport system ATP-binding protein